VSGLDNDTMAELFAERGGDPGRPGKKDPLDPLVWLAARPGEPSWPSGFGPGRPGWHVECAAIATEYLGVRFDIQAGGTDLAFPHHEMSALHARAAQRGARGGDGPAFARVYVHAGMVRLGGEKMSKSLGNLVFVSGLLRGGADPMAIRLAILAHHYRHDWDWTEEGLAEARARLGRWRAAASAAPRGPGPDAPVPAATAPAPTASGAQAGPVPAAGDVLAAVRARLADDLDAPGALAAVDGWADAVLVGSGPAAGPGAAGLVSDTVDALLGVAL
jgi:L-cysteine:1D-myo-inositol 2-amino-2-deoxy-alpha-D-glucopyranoside ligase